MSEFKVRINEVRTAVQDQNGIAGQMRQLESEILSVQNHLSFQIAQKERIRQRLAGARNATASHYNGIYNAAKALGQVASTYETTETKLAGARVSATVLEATHNIEAPSVVKSRWETFVTQVASDYGLKDALKGAGHIGVIYGLANDLKNAKSWGDYFKTGKKLKDFLNSAAKTYKNYKKIGNAVGTKKAMTWWAKSITGFKPLGRASTAKNISTRFINNLKNKTSPFNAQIKDTIGNFKGANGVGKAVASWGAVALNGLLNWQSNKEEQAGSNGSMSEGRVWAETITETAVDTALTYGASAVIGAGITAVIGPVAAPGILVVAASGLVLTGLNAGVKALTGKTTTEWISDTILDTGKAIGKAVGSGVKKVADSVGSWFKKLRFA